jgi:hypothetical protein
MRSPRALPNAYGDIGEWNSAGQPAAAASGVATRVPLRGISKQSSNAVWMGGTTDTVRLLKSGLYAVTIAVMWQLANSTGNRWAGLYVNGSALDWMETGGSGSPGFTYLRPGPFYVDLIAGDTLEVYSNQSSTVSINVYGALVLERKR